MEKIAKIIKLVKEYNGDSLSKKEQAEEELLKEIDLVLDQLRTKSREYNTSYWDDYDPKLCKLEVTFANLEEGTIGVESSDPWDKSSIGSHLVISIPEFFSPSYIDSMEKEFKEKRKQFLIQDYNYHSRRLKEIKEELEKYKDDDSQ